MLSYKLSVVFWLDEILASALLYSIKNTSSSSTNNSCYTNRPAVGTKSSRIRLTSQGISWEQPRKRDCFVFSWQWLRHWYCGILAGIWFHDFTDVCSPLWFYFKENQLRWPTIFKLAMDILPIQALAVPCERVFSSGKETMTAGRSRLSHVMMEALQMKPGRWGSLGALALVPMDHKLSCQSLSSVTYLVGWHLRGSVAPNELMSCPGAVKLTLLGWAPLDILLEPGIRSSRISFMWPLHFSST